MVGRRGPVRRARDGLVMITLRLDEAELVGLVLGEMERAIAEDRLEDDARARLYPRAYLDPTEEEAERDWEQLVHDDLTTARLAAFRTVSADLAAAEAGREITVALDAERETSWLTALNDARLIMGTTLGVTEEEPVEFSPDDPRAAWAELYQWLTYLQQELVDVLLDALPETGRDDLEAR
jgi:S-formylglutathione hydrolase FrmB